MPRATVSLHLRLLSLFLLGAQQTEDDMRHSLFCVCPPSNIPIPDP